MQAVDGQLVIRILIEYQMRVYGATYTRIFVFLWRVVPGVGIPRARVRGEAFREVLTKYKRKGRGGMRTGALKRAGGLLMAAVLMLSLVPSVMAAESQSVKEFRNGKTKMVSGDSVALIALQEDGSLWGIGNATNGYLGNFENNDYSKTVRGETNYYFTIPHKLMENVAFIDRHGSTAVVKTDGSLWMSGYKDMNGNYVLGFEEIMSDVVSVSASHGHCMAIKKDGSVWSWGANYEGQLGIGTVNPRPEKPITTPVKVDIDHAAKVSVGGNNSLVLKTDGSLWACGSTYGGMVGNGVSGTDDLSVRAQPTFVKIMDDVVDMGVDNLEYCYAIKKDGSLWGWGDVSYFNKTQETCLPVKLMDGVKSFHMDMNRVIYLNLSGELWLHDRNDNKDTLLAKDVAIYDGDSSFIKNDGSLWYCSGNANYILGSEFERSEEVSGWRVPHQLAGPVQTAPVPSTIPPVSQSATAKPTASKILLDDKAVSLDVYNINSNNYCKIRDVAMLLNGTGKQFEVTWDKTLQAVSLNSNRAYTAVGGELAKGDGESKTATLNTAKIYLDGKEVSLTAYSIGGNNYIKLRDLGQTFDFGVSFDSAAGAVRIDTTKGYTPE